MSEAPRPAYVVFETRPVEDREETLKQGHFVAKDVHFAIVTPAGTRDRIEREVTLWFDSLKEGVAQERIPHEWLRAYEAAYKDWCENRETPEFGIPLGNWPGISPAQVLMLQDIGLRTVEQVAEATEEAISRMGMGGRALKAKAQAFLDVSNDTGKVAAELEALRHQVQELQTRADAREEELAKLQSENAALKKTGK